MASYTTVIIYINKIKMILWKCFSYFIVWWLPNLFSHKTVFTKHLDKLEI